MKQNRLMSVVVALALALPLLGGDFDSWPKGKEPSEISGKLTDLLLSTRPESYKPEGYESPQGYAKNGYGNGRHVQYSVVSLWVNALECAKMKGDKVREEKLIRLYDDFLPGGRLHGICSNPYHVDFTIFGSIPLQIYLHNGDKRCLEHGLFYADTQWTPPCEGTLTQKHAHPKETQERFWAEGYTPQTRLWIDDMYMIIAIQSQAFRATGDRKYIDRTAKEMCLYIDELQVKDGKDKGLFYHAPDVPFVWGRGAGWMAAGMSLVLEYVPANSPCRAKILEGYRLMMAALLERQRPNGMWNQLVGDPKSWEETSCTAMYGYVFATGVKNGFLDAKAYGPAARKAYLALCDRIDARGNVRDVCCGTGKKNDYQYYLDRPHVHGDPHGQCALMWMCRTFLEMETKGRPVFSCDHADAIYATVYVPALTDLLGFKADGRESGWPRLIEGQLDGNKAAAERNAPYFCGVNFARNITFPIRFEVGGADTVCPPMAGFSAFNVTPSKDKDIVMGVGQGHAVFPELKKKHDAWLYAE